MGITVQTELGAFPPEILSRGMTRVRCGESYRYAGGEELEVPHPPGVTAKRIGPRRVLVTYRIGEDDDKCHAEWLYVVADVSGDLMPPAGRPFPIAEERSGQVVLRLIDGVADADRLVASTKTKPSALASDSTSIRIR